MTIEKTPAIIEVEEKAHAAKAAASALAVAGSLVKNKALAAMSKGLESSSSLILEANQRDVAAAKDRGLADAMVDRLALNQKKIAAMREGLEQVAALPDPIGAVMSGWVRPNGLQISKVRVPIGVIGIIFESRPNVTVDAAALCLKSGNTTVLRGGSEAIHSNTALANVLQDALESVGLPRSCVELLTNTDRAAARHLMTLNGVVDCLIPRGGASLIKTVIETASIPVIETGTGNCHIYIDKDGDFDKAIPIIINAKTSKPSVCNAAETLLVHCDVAEQFLPLAGEKLIAAGVELHADERAAKLLSAAVPANEEDWYAEYLSLTLAVKVVDSLDDAINHINKYGTKHSEAIITENYAAGQEFIDRIDAAAVYINASTRFTDGFQFGFGAEIGISNQKLHARGPMGLEELTTYKYIVRGNGQICE